MDAGKNDMVKDLHTGKVYRIIKIEYGIVLLEDVGGLGASSQTRLPLRGFSQKWRSNGPGGRDPQGRSRRVMLIRPQKMQGFGPPQGIEFNPISFDGFLQPPGHPGEEPGKMEIMVGFHPRKIPN
jgi:hypothetical protein